MSARGFAGAIVSGYPWPYLPMVRRKYPGQMVDAGTELVIEAFPRSGNTFAVVAFELSQDGPVKVAHHLHAASQVTRGVSLGKPTLVLIRYPIDAVVSHLVREPGVTPRQGMRNWVRFYRSIQEVRNDVVVATFEDVTTDFGSVIDRLNERFGTSFIRFDHSRENVERCFDRIEQRNGSCTRAWSNRRSRVHRLPATPRKNRFDPGCRVHGCDRWWKPQIDCAPRSWTVRPASSARGV